MEGETERSNERKTIPDRVRGREIKKGGVKEEGKASRLSTRRLHRGAAGLNDKVPIKPRWSLLPAAKRGEH